MSEAQALYVPDGDAFVGTTCTRGSWYANGQSGGAVLALLGHVVEDVPTPTAMSLSRLTVDLVRPVPVGERLWVDQEVIREGKRIQVVDAVVRSSEAVHVRARALRIRDADLRDWDPAPRSSTDDAALAELPAPEELDSAADHPGVADFLRLGAEFRRTTEPFHGAHCAWVRLRVPVVLGEPIRSTSRAALPMDCVNLLGVGGLPADASAINPDVSAHVVRAPRGEWAALLGHTRFAAAVGHGFSTAMLVDRDGVFGVTSTSQVVERTG